MVVWDWVLYQVDASHQGALGQQVTSVNEMCIRDSLPDEGALRSLRRHYSPGRPGG